MASDLTLVSASMESATLSLCQQHGDYMRSYADRETYRVLGLTYARLLEGLKRSSGIDATSIEPRWSDAYFHAEKSNPLDRSKDRWDRLTDLEETLGKLATLPDALRTGTNYGPYEQALEDARRLRLAATDATYDFAPEGVDPESIPQGHPPPRFGGIYEIIEMDSSEFWIVDVTTGEKIRQAGEDMHLLGGLHADHQRYHCHEGRSSIPFLGIAKGDEVDRMTFDCRIPTQDLETSFATLRRANDSGHGAELVAERVFERLTGFESGCGWSREHKTRETTVFGVSPSFQTSRGKPTWEELVEKGASLCLRSNLAIRSSPLRVLHDGSASQRRTSSKTRMRR